MLVLRVFLKYCLFPYLKFFFFFLLLLALQPTVGFSLLSDFSSILPFLHIAFSTVLLPLFANLLQCLQSFSSVVSL